MARPKKDIADKLTFRYPTTQCSEEQLANFWSNAKQVGMSGSTYTRQMLSSGQVILQDNRPRLLEKSFAHHLKNNLGEWLNSLTHRANATGVFPHNLQDCLLSLTAYLEHIILIVQVFDGYIEDEKTQGRTHKNDFDNALVEQVKRIDTNLLQLQNLANATDIKPREIYLCKEKIDILLDRFIYAQTFNE